MRACIECIVKYRTYCWWIVLENEPLYVTRSNKDDLIKILLLLLFLNTRRLHTYIILTQVTYEFILRKRNKRFAVTLALSSLCLKPTLYVMATNKDDLIKILLLLLFLNTRRSIAYIHHTNIGNLIMSSF